MLHHFTPSYILVVHCVHVFVVSVCLCRYVLISRPSEWSDQLRVKFLEGLDAFLELLKCMQVTLAHTELALTWTGVICVPPPEPVSLSVCVSGYGSSGATGGPAHRDGA